MLVLLAALAALQTAEQCKTAMDQPTMNVCASDEFDRADQALNAQWAKTLKFAREHDQGDGPSWNKREPALRAAQRAWVTFRDSHCASLYVAAFGANLEYTQNIYCRTQLTIERTKQLQEVAEWLPESGN